jgi:hypothetical protein
VGRQENIRADLRLIKAQINVSPEMALRLSKELGRNHILVCDKGQSIFSFAKVS